MKRNAFVFVETIIVTTILTVALLFVYMTFSNVLNNEKRRVAFDDTGYMYKTYYLEDFIVSFELDRYINKYFKGDDAVDIKQFACNDPILYRTSYNDTDYNTNEDTYQYEKKSKMCEKMINNSDTYGVYKVYISKYNVNDIKECTTAYGKAKNELSGGCKKESTLTSLANVDMNFIYYLRTLSASNRNIALQNAYRLIVEFKEEETDLENVMEKKTCSQGYKYDGLVCRNDAGQVKTPQCLTDYVEDNGKCVRKVTKYYYNSVILIPKGSA